MHSRRWRTLGCSTCVLETASLREVARAAWRSRGGTILLRKRASPALTGSLGGISGSMRQPGWLCPRACVSAPRRDHPQKPELKNSVRRTAWTPHCVLERRREAALEAYGAINPTMEQHICSGNQAGETRALEPHRSYRVHCARPKAFLEPHVSGGLGATSCLDA